MKTDQKENTQYIYKGIAYLVSLVGYGFINNIFVQLKGFEFTVIFQLSAIIALLTLIYFSKH